MSDRYICRDWREAGTRPRGWDPIMNRHHANSKAALIDPRPEPGFWPTLAAFIRNNPRTWRVSVAVTTGAVLALIGSMFQ